MNHKIKNSIMLVSLASAIIACNGGNSSNNQSSSQNVRLPQPQINDAIASDAAKVAPFLTSATGLVQAFIPGASDFLSVAQAGVGLINFLEPSIGFAQVMSKLDAMSNQINQIESQVVVQLNLSDNIITDINNLQINSSYNDLKANLSTASDFFSGIEATYQDYVNAGVFGTTNYINPIQTLYTYAESQCNNQSILDVLNEKTYVPAATSDFTAASPVAMPLYQAAQAFTNQFITSNDASQFWSGFSKRTQNYMNSIFATNVIPQYDVGTYLSYFNYETLKYTLGFYGTWDKLRLMQLAKTAYYFACTSQSFPDYSLSNITPASGYKLPANNQGGLTAYTQNAYMIYSYYNQNFYGPNPNTSTEMANVGGVAGLKSVVTSNLQPYTNAEFTTYLNTMLFKNIGGNLLESNTFAKAGATGAIPQVTNSCSIKNFKLESDNFVHMTANCLVESNNKGFTYRTVSNKIPYVLNTTSSGLEISSTYGYNNLHYIESRQIIVPTTINLSIPVSSSSPDYATSSAPTNAVEISVYGTPTASTVNVESSIFIFGSPWSNDNTTVASCGSWTDGDGKVFPLCAGADKLISIINATTKNSTYGYNTIFSPPIVSYNNILAASSGTWSTQAYYYASYQGKLFTIQFVMNAAYSSSFGDSYAPTSGGVYFYLHCITNDCTAAPLNSSANPMLQLTWQDGTVIQVINNNFSEWGNLSINVSKQPNNIVNRKTFQFESDISFAQWMESESTESTTNKYPYKAYLNGKVKYSPLDATNTTSILVSKNYTSGSYYQLVYVPGSKQLQIQNCTNGTCNLTNVVANLTESATELQLNYGDVMLYGGDNGNILLWSVSQQYQANNKLWASSTYAEVILTDTGLLNIYADDASNQAGVSGTSPDDSNYSRMLWSSSNFPWASVNNGTYLGM